MFNFQISEESIKNETFKTIKINNLKYMKFS